MHALLTSTWFPIALAALALLLGIPLIVKTSRLIGVVRLQRRRVRDGTFLYDYLRIYYPRRRLFRDLPLLSEDSMFVIGESGRDIRRTADVAYVGRGGVLLLTAIPDRGNFDTPKSGNWKIALSLSRGGQEGEGGKILRDFPNPFETTTPHPRAVANLLAPVGLSRAPVTRAVVLTADGVYYTTVYRELLSLGTLLRFVRTFDLQKNLTRNEVRRICRRFAEVLPKGEK